MISQDATDLRLGCDRSPKLSRKGEALRFTMPATSTDTLRRLLGEMYDVRRHTLKEVGVAEFTYESERYGPFRVTLARRPGSDTDFSAHFSRGVPANAGAATAPSAVAAPASPKRDRVPKTSVDALAEPTAPPSRPSTVVNGRPAVTQPDFAPSPQLVKLLDEARRLDASDLHLSAAGPQVVRINGRLKPLADVPNLDILESFGGARLGSRRSVDLAFELPTLGRFRANLYDTATGLVAAIRLLKTSVPAFAQLGLPSVVSKAADLAHGLVIVTGATGSGKTTTLASLAQRALQSRRRLLISVEDPIEYRIAAGTVGSLVRQREIGRHVPDFQTGLRDALREDPDLLLVGEMRDRESISLGLTAAETGHLVLTSLHSRTAVSTVERIVDVYPPERQRQIRVQLADSLAMVICQRLVRRRGSTGRVAVAEVMVVTPAVSNLIREGKTAQLHSLLQSGKEHGMVTLEAELARLVREGQISVQDADANANDLSALRAYLR